MRKLLFCLMLCGSFMISAQTKILLTVNNESVTATLADNEATKELLSMLSINPITVRMSDYGGFEKVGPLPQSLLTSNTQITTEAGDIMLYQGNNIVIFYGSNSWSYTRLGRIDNATVENVRKFLGTGNITMTISLPGTSGIEENISDKNVPQTVYDLKGNVIIGRPLRPGIYIIDGIKTIIK
ncbi:MAG: hypothetical protein K2J12_07170 [Muribaculaceae bacterium]|nr:hypothetical protein [Muribaculaceae bacterium]